MKSMSDEQKLNYMAVFGIPFSATCYGVLDEEGEDNGYN